MQEVLSGMLMYPPTMPLSIHHTDIYNLIIEKKPSSLLLVSRYLSPAKIMLLTGFQIPPPGRFPPHHPIPSKRKNTISYLVTSPIWTIGILGPRRQAAAS